MLIRHVREELGWSQERLAESVGVGAAMLGRYERGAKFPSYVTLVRLARVLKLSTDQMLGLETERRAARAADAKAPQALDLLPPGLRDAMLLVAHELTSKTGYARRSRKPRAAAPAAKPKPAAKAKATRRRSPSKD